MSAASRGARNAFVTATLVLMLLATGVTAASADTTDPPPDPPTEPTTTSLTIDSPAQGLKRREIDLVAVLSTLDGPVADAALTFQRDTGRGWTDLGSATTDRDGRATLAARTPDSPAQVAYRAVFAGTETTTMSESPTSTVRGLDHRIVWRVRGPNRIVDETSANLRFVLRTADGQPIEGAKTVVSRFRDGEWAPYATRRTDSRGSIVLDVSPRVDTRWRAETTGGPWFRAGRSERLLLDNVPPGAPVVLPPGAPQPRVRVPEQPRAVGDGANVSITRIPDAIWNDMTGKSWRPGCTSRDQLRLVRANYWGYDGYRHRGELVVRADTSAKFERALRGIYANRLPIRSMYRVDRFGYSARLHGGDDYASMAAGNTSAFNCRWVVGRPGVNSPHSTGRSFDINPWENPYASAQDGWVPNTWWVGKSHPRVAWRSSDHLMVRTLRAAGFRWTYGVRDAHHFDG